MSTSFRIIQSGSDHVRSIINQEIQQQRITPLTLDQWPLKAEQISSGQKIGSPSNTAAIDFGTTYSSVVYKTEDEAIDYLKLNAIYERVPTAILLEVVDRPEDPCLPVKFTVKEYGMRALIAYSRLRERDRRHYIYFERVKLTLHHDEVNCSVL